MRTRLFFLWLKILRWLGYRDRVNAIAAAWLLRRGPQMIVTLTVNTEHFARQIDRAAARLRRLSERLDAA